jgi:hypothetical protein
MDRKTRFVLSALVLFSCFVLLALATYTSPRPGSVTSANDPVQARFAHTATLLQNGRVLIAGGMERNGVWLNSAELWDPDNERFVPAGGMFARRAGATATLLPSGQVLIAGGSDGSAPNLSSAELFDPHTSLFSRTGDMLGPRAHATAILLRSGKVLIAGGNASGDNEQLATAEIYDPVTGKFAPTGNLQSARSYYTAVMLKDGRVLLTGGLSGGQYPWHQVEATAEIFDPATERFTLTGSLATPRFKHGAALLPDGRVLIAGGSNENGRQYEYSSTEIFDPKTGRFSAGPSMNFERYKMLSGVVALQDGRILIAGGAGQMELYDPAKSTIVPIAGPPLNGFFYNTATVLRDGRVLLVDGYGYRPASGAVRQARLFEP